MLHTKYKLHGGLEGRFCGWCLCRRYGGLGGLGGRLMSRFEGRAIRGLRRGLGGRLEGRIRGRRGRRLLGRHGRRGGRRLCAPELVFALFGGGVHLDAGARHAIVVGAAGHVRAEIASGGGLEEEEGEDGGLHRASGSSAEK